MTNPWYSGAGLPKSGLQSAVEIHKSLLADVTASFAVAYKTILWTKIVPGNQGVLVDVCGDKAAKDAISDILTAHGFIPVDKGGLEVSASLEPGRRS